MKATTIAAVTRHILGIAAGWLLAKGIELDSTSIETISGAVGGLVAVGWSLWSKRGDKPSTSET